MQGLDQREANALEDDPSCAGAARHVARHASSFTSAHWGLVPGTAVGGPAVRDSPSFGPRSRVQIHQPKATNDEASDQQHRKSAVDHLAERTTKCPENADGQRNFRGQVRKNRVADTGSV